MRTLFLTLGAVVVLAAARPATAASYVVGVEALPYLPHYGVEGGEYRGFARDVLDEFARAEGIRFEYRPLPVTRLFRSLVDGDVDFKYPDSPHWNRSIKEGTEVFYSAAVAPYVDGVMVLPDALGRPPWALRTLGTVRGFTPWAWMAEVRTESVDVHENPSLEGLLRQVIAGRVDGAYVNADVARYLMAHRIGTPGALRFDPGLPHVSDAYQLSTTLHPDLVEAFDRWLDANREFLAGKQAQWGIGGD